MTYVRLAAWLVVSVAGLAGQRRQQLDLGAGVSLELVHVPAGQFTQQEPGEAGRSVTLSSGFWLGRTEVSKGQFARFVAATGYRTEAERGQSGGYGFDGRELHQHARYTWRSPGFAQTDAHPVCLVTYRDALEFCQWAAKVSGRAVTLPSEAQWEHANRLGGEPADLARAAWFAKNAGDGTRPVATAEPDALGLCDLRGNVFEWCLDWFAPYGTAPVRDPLVTAQSAGVTRRVLRGGSWRHDAKNCATGARWRSDPGSRSCDNGFRVAVNEAQAAAVSANVPQAPAERGTPAPVPQPMPQRSSGDESACLSPWLIAGVGLVVLLLLFARGKKPAAPPSDQTAPAPRAPAAGVGAGPLSQVRVEKATDGVWLRAPENLGDLLVRARHRGKSQPWREVRVRLFGKQFVYTGVLPEQFEVLEVLAAGDADATWGAMGEADVARRTAHHDRHDDDSDGFVGGLSAY